MLACFFNDSRFMLKSFSCFCNLLCTDVNPPTSITSDALLSTSITFTWSEATCDDPCSGITGYEWQLLQSGSEVNSGMTVETTVTIPDLTPCTQCTFHVAGVSADGRGSFSEETLVTTDGEGNDTQR